MNNILSYLGNDFTIVDLGSGFAESSAALKPFHPAITCVELDAANRSNRNPLDYKRHECITKAVAGVSGKQTLYNRAMPNASSLTPTRAELVHAYGLERFLEIKSQETVAAVSLSELLESLQLSQVDWLKTDS